MLDRFQLRKELHHGSSGEVWLARERDTRELVVARLAHQDRAVERLRREGEALARADHPGVPRLIAQGPLTDGGWCVIEEHLEGAQLSKVLRVTSPSPSRTAGWGRQLASALAHLHAIGIAHGDLHPDNVIVARDEAGRDRLVLTGFGLSAVGGDAAATPLGAAQVAAPERARGEGPSPAADIYALGAVLYRMLADRWPFVGPDAAVLQDQLATPPPPFGRHTPEMRLPPGLEQIVFRCLAKDGAGRYPSADELCAELARVEFSPHRDWVRVGGGADPAPPATPVPVPRDPPVRLGRVVLAALALLALALLLSRLL